jgi:3-oxoacyl-(acyl-carrier-protein) synthase
MTSIVVTGMGLVSPYGVGSDVLWKKLMAGETGLKVLTSFDTSHLQCRVGGQLTDFLPQDYLNRRLLHKLDRFSVLGLVAIQQALDNAGLLSDDGKPVWNQWEQQGNRVGITVGNNLAGWEFGDRELRNLWQQGPREISPYMATAWFPASLQGNASIQLGIKGIGRTFLSDRTSGAHAIIHAANCLARGRADVMLAGGSEAPFTPFATLSYETSGLMSKQSDTYSTTAYRPFDRNHNGLVAAEGAAFFVLERAEDACKRSATVIAELAGWASTHDGYDFVQPAPDGERYAAAMTQAMERASIDAEDIDCVFAAGSAVPSEDVSETRAIHLALGDAAKHIPVSTPKSAFGNLFGAATPLDMAIALLAMQQQIIPSTLHFDDPAQGCDLDYVPGMPRSVNCLNICLVNARSIGGTNASLLLRRWS